MRILLVLAALLFAAPAHAFCGFYVGKAETGLFNHGSKVVLVRDGEHTVLTMDSDYEGALDQFALVVPVPVKLEREQVQVTDRALIDHLDAYSAPRLVEYPDPDPCPPPGSRWFDGPVRGWFGASADALAGEPLRLKAAVRVEARYDVGEYQIVILASDQSDALASWLTDNGYRVPPSTARAIEPYVRQGMRFFVAKVNLAVQARSGRTELRPIQIAYDSEKFMLPIRLGMANAKGPQDLTVFAITRHGRVESTNYRTVKIPSDVDVPTSIQPRFADFYAATFSKAVAREDHRAVFTEYFWNMSYCDPCSATPLKGAELRKLGVFWVGGNEDTLWGAPVELTRLHVRYDDEHFPEDLVFQITSDESSFQARYVMHPPWTGKMECEEAVAYRASLADRAADEAHNVMRLTGWTTFTPPSSASPPQPPARRMPWYRRILH